MASGRREAGLTVAEALLEGSTIWKSRTARILAIDIWKVTYPTDIIWDG